MTNKTLQPWNEVSYYLLIHEQENISQSSWEILLNITQQTQYKTSNSFYSLNEIWAFSSNSNYFNAGEDVTGVQNSHILYLRKTITFFMTFNKNI